jgi:hypothetical protein
VVSEPSTTASAILSQNDSDRIDVPRGSRIAEWAVHVTDDGGCAPAFVGKDSLAT